MDNSKKRIINAQQHNCAHCGTKGANYGDAFFIIIDESPKKQLGVLRIKCSCCGQTSTHIIKNLCQGCRDFFYRGSSEYQSNFYVNGTYFYITDDVKNLDENIIMSIPTPTFVIDSGIPSKLRNLLIEAGKCVKENALTGASACVRKAIYEFLLMEKAEGRNYDEKIKSIKSKWPHLEEYLDVLRGIKGVVSDQVHEDSFEAFTSEQIKSYVDILEEIFREIYVIPQKRQERKAAIFEAFNATKKDKEAKQDAK